MRDSEQRAQPNTIILDPFIGPVGYPWVQAPIWPAYNHHLGTAHFISKNQHPSRPNWRSCVFLEYFSVSFIISRMYTQVSIPVGWNISLSLLFSGKQKNTFLPRAYLILKSRKMEVGLGSSLQGTNTFHLLHAKGNKNSPYLNGLSKLYLSFVSWKKITMALSLRNV